MPTPFPSARHQAAINTPTGYRRRMTFTFSRGGVSQVLEPISGQLTQDARRNGRWDGRLSFLGDENLPNRPGDLLTPFGTRVSVTLGLELLDGSVSTVPYGVYEIATAKANETADARTVDISLADISGVVDRYRFETSLTLGASRDLSEVINQVVLSRTGINPGVSAIGTTLGSVRIFGLDTSTGPWAEVLDVLSSFSRTAWYNRVGRIEVGSIDADISTSYPLPGVASRSVDFDTRPPNVVVARSDPQDGNAPYQQVALDSDPSSPTYAGTGPGTSPYGRVTTFFSSPLILNDAQALAAAKTILATSIGAGATSTITLPYDPTISAGDVVSQAGITYVVDAATVDLTGETSLAVREIS
jgi:hypothetical protein